MRQVPRAMRFGPLNNIRSIDEQDNLDDTLPDTNVDGGQ